MQELFTLGELYPSDFLKPDEEPRSQPIELKLLMDDNGAVRLEKTAPLDKMFGKYWYRSGINQTMKDELKDIVSSITKIYKLKENDLWIDIASNDGTLLSFVPPNLIKVGIDPADDTYKIEAEKNANLIIQDFFSAKVFKKSKFGQLKAKVITSIAMFYDLENPDIFIKDIDQCLDDNGIWVLQLSYTPLMIEQMAFDNICFKPDADVMGTNKSISNLDVGDKVLDMYGDYTTIVKKYENQYSGDMYNIKAEYLNTISSTPDHPFLIVKKCDFDTKKSNWVEAKNIEIDDYLIIPKLKTREIERKIDLSQFNKSNSPNYRRGLKTIELTDDVLWMMGIYLAEGHISGRENNLQINFTLNVTEQHYAEKIKDVFAKIGYKTIIRKNKQSNSINVQSSCTSLARIFTMWFGKGARNKKIPDFIFTAKSDVVIPFLTGLIDGDGCLDGNQVGYHSASKTLVYQVQLMLATLNEMTGWSYVKPYIREIRGGIVNSKDSWQIRGKNIFLDKIFYSNSYILRSNIRYSYDDNYVYVPVKSIMKEPYNGLVYNIETENHTYVVSNAVVHNCHEHVFYYSLFNLKKLFEKYGFQIVDCQLNDINGGSFRVYAMKSSANVKTFGTQPYRDVCNFRVQSLLEYEKTLKLDQTATWARFLTDIDAIKEKTVSFIKEQKALGKKVWGYGASTKGNTLLQYFGLDHTLIDGIAERSQYKWGLKTIGTNIPIYSEDEMRRAKPDFLIVLPWHFINEFCDREKDYLMGGGCMIVPCPKFEIIGK